MLYHTKLDVLVIDKNKSESDELISLLQKHKGEDKEKQVGVIRNVDCLEKAEEIICHNDINCIIIDPVSFNLDESSCLGNPPEK